ILAVAIRELVVHYRSGGSSQQERGEKPGVGHGQCASYDTVSKKSMRTLFVSLLLLIAPAFAGDEQFNGRWDIKVINEPRNRAWWLEVDGAGTSALKGRFVGFPGGNINGIPEMSISGGELTFKWDRNKEHQVYRARLAGDKLEGS